MTENKYAYDPDYAVPPGATLEETLDALGLTQKGLSDRTGLTTKTINEIIKGKAPITAETALMFEKVLGAPARFWNSLERNYREDIARSAESEKLRGKVNWLKRFPLSELIERGYIKPERDKIRSLEQLLTFFGVASPDEWETVWNQTAAEFRKSHAHESRTEAVASWLRIGELVAQKTQTRSYHRDEFLGAMKSIRRLCTAIPANFQTKIVDTCAHAGVAVAFVREIKGAPVSGATRWLSSEKALIQLSLRYKSEDQLWFTLGHEAAHILLHGKKDVFLDGQMNSPVEKEREADRWASDWLIPPASWKNFIGSRFKGNISKMKIIEFAAQVGISPGIVVGRLQHEKYLPYTHCNDLKIKLVWSDNNS